MDGPLAIARTFARQAADYAANAELGFRHFALLHHVELRNRSAPWSTTTIILRVRAK